MDFIIDENIPAELVSWLNQKGHNTFTVPKGNSDEKVAYLAKEHESILLTQDRHFTNTLRFPPKEFFGIIRIKIHPPYIENITFSLEKLLVIINKQEDMQGKLIILDKEGFFKLKG